MRAVSPSQFVGRAVLVGGVSLALIITGSPTIAAEVALAPPALVASDEDFVRPDPVSAMVSAQSLGQRVEDESQRDEVSRVYANPDGSWTSETSSGPESVMDPASGEWVPVDTTLVKVDGGWRAKAAVSDVVLSDGGDRVFAALKEQGKDLGWKWTGVLPKPVVVGSTATYPDVVENGDLVVTALSTGFTYNIVLRSRPSKPLVLKLPIVNDGAVVSENAQGGLQVKTKRGLVLTEAPAPLMWDASQNVIGDPTVRPVDTSVGVGVSGEQTLTLSPDAGFLADPATVYPVTVDPTFTSIATADTWVQNAEYTNSMSGSDELRAGTYDGGAHKARSFLKFNDGDWNGKQILSAELRLRNWLSLSCGGSAIRANLITESWSNADVTWANQPSVTSTASATYSPAHGGPSGSSCVTGADASWAMGPAVQRWANGSTVNNGLRLAADNETVNASWRRYRSLQQTTTTGTGILPKLIVSYNSYPNTPSGLTVTPLTAYAPPNGVSANYTSDTTPLLTAKASDPDAGSVQIRFEVRAAASETATLLASCTSGFVPQGTNASCSPTPALADGQTVWLRAKAYDGVGWPGTTMSSAVGWSTWTTFKIAAGTPSAPSLSCPSPHSNGSWLDDPPTADVVCTVSATGTGTTAPGYIRWSLNGGTEARVKIAQSTDPAVAKTTLTVPASPGGYQIVARGESPSGVLSAAQTYTLGYGRFSMTSPVVTDAGTSSLTTANTVQFSAAGPPNATANPVASLQWRVASSGDNEVTGWNSIASPNLSVSSSASGASATGIFNTAALVRDDAQAIDLDPRTPVLLEFQVCLAYPSGNACTWSTSKVRVLRVPHAFGDGFPVADAGPGQVALWTGEFATAATDVRVPGYQTGLSISRTHSTFSGPSSGAAGVFGPAWSAQIDGADIGLAGMLAVDSTSRDGTVSLVDPDGSTLVYAPTLPAQRRITATLLAGIYKALDKDTALSGVKLQVAGSGAGTKITVTDPDGTVTVFSTATIPGINVPATFVAESVQEPGQVSQTTFSYDSQKRVTRILSPVPSGVTCPATGTLAPGCRALQLAYNTAGLLDSVNYIAGGTTIPVGTYSYDTANRLTSVTDPRTGQTTSYGYDGTSTRLQSIAPNGTRPFQFAYSGTANRFQAATRTNPNGSGTTTLARVVYDVPTDGTGGTPSVAPSVVAQWGQAKAPTHGYAVFGAEKPNVGPQAVDVTAGDWPYATLFFTDDRGYTTNTADYGSGRWLYTHSEYDGQGNIVRTLNSRDIAGILDAQVMAADAGILYSYAAVTNSAGTITIPAGAKLTDSFGPARYSVLPDGSTALTRVHTHTEYDQEAPNEGINPVTNDAYGLPTTTKITIRDVATGVDLTDELSITKLDYTPVVAGDPSGWDLGSPITATQVMPNPANNITTKVRYNDLGQVIESRQPSSDGSDAGTRKIRYYTSGTNPDDALCGNKPAWAGMPCVTLFAGSAADGPLTVNRVTAYDDLYMTPLTVTDTVGGTPRRSTNMTYDSAGRISKTWITTTGVAGSTPSSGEAYTYDPTTGLVTSQSATDSAGTIVGDPITTGYDTWGRLTTYSAIPGETTTTSYNSVGQVDSIADPKGTTTYTYNGTDAAGKVERRGLPISQTTTNTGGPEVKFDAAYDAGGSLITQKMPGGVTQRLTLDSVGEPIGLTYSGQVTTTNPDGSTTTTPDTPWLGWAQDNDTLGRVAREWTPQGAGYDATMAGGTAAGYSRAYKYDRAGRLVHVDDIISPAGSGQTTQNADGTTTSPTGAVCQRRDYTFDSNGNRTSLSRTPPAADGTCGTVGAQIRTWTYDAADRLTGGNVYDSLGRVTTIPAVDTPGGNTAGALTLGYYDSDAVKSITQGGVTSTFDLDAAGRRATTTIGPTGGSPSSTETRHYADATDNPAWIVNGNTFTRYTESISGELAATITNTGAVTIPLVDLHGDIVSIVDLPASGPAISIGGWFDTDEYGNPLNTTAGATPGSSGYGWLGGHQRATDASGLLLMGDRVYNPTTGAFTSIDPMFGGNTTVYAYPQDPINNYDLDGRGFGSWFNDHKKTMSKALSVVSITAGALALFTPCSALCGGISAAAGVTNAFFEASEGDWTGAGLDVAGALAFGAPKGLKLLRNARTSRVSKKWEQDVSDGVKKRVRQKTARQGKRNARRLYDRGIRRANVADTMTYTASTSIYITKTATQHYSRPAPRPTAGRSYAI